MLNELQNSGAAKAYRRISPQRAESAQVLSKAWDSFHDVEELDMKPAQFIKRVYLRPRYVNRAEGKVVIAEMPNRFIEKGLAGPGLLAQVVVGKYEDHLPLYRQAKMFAERHGVEIARQRLIEWFGIVGWKPVVITVWGKCFGVGKRLGF